MLGILKMRMSLKNGHIRKVFLEEVVFELSLKDFDHVTMKKDILDREKSKSKGGDVGEQSLPSDDMG